MENISLKPDGSATLIRIDTDTVTITVRIEPKGNSATAEPKKVEDKAVVVTPANSTANTGSTGEISGETDTDTESGQGDSGTAYDITGPQTPTDLK